MQDNVERWTGADDCVPIEPGGTGSACAEHLWTVHGPVMRDDRGYLGLAGERWCRVVRNGNSLTLQQGKLPMPQSGVDADSRADVSWPLWQDGERIMGEELLSLGAKLAEAVIPFRAIKDFTRDEAGKSFLIHGRDGTSGLAVWINPDGSTLLQPVDEAAGPGFGLSLEAVRDLEALLTSVRILPPGSIQVGPFPEEPLAGSPEAIAGAVRQLAGSWPDAGRIDYLEAENERLEAQLAERIRRHEADARDFEACRKAKEDETARAFKAEQEASSLADALEAALGRINACVNKLEAAERWKLREVIPQVKSALRAAWRLP